MKLQLHSSNISAEFFFFQRLETNVVGFVRTELRRFKEMLAPSQSDILESRQVDEGERRSREAVLKITLDFLRKMEQDQLSHLLQTSMFEDGSWNSDVAPAVASRGLTPSLSSQELLLLCTRVNSKLC